MDTKATQQDTKGDLLPQYEGMPPDVRQCRCGIRICSRAALCILATVSILGGLLTRTSILGLIPLFNKVCRVSFDWLASTNMIFRRRPITIGLSLVISLSMPAAAGLNALAGSGNVLPPKLLSPSQSI